jgi:hypothetical protein
MGGNCKFESVIQKRKRIKAKKMSEPEEFKKQRIAQLASRESGIIPIREFVNENECNFKVKKALLTGLEEGLFYYLDDITLKKYLSIPWIGYRSWCYLIENISAAIIAGKFQEQSKALDKHFYKQDRCRIL